MRLNWKILRPAILAVALLGAGCSGINTSQSISPASFFLPGLMQVAPKTNSIPAPFPPQELAPTLAQAK